MAFVHFAAAFASALAIATESAWTIEWEDERPSERFVLAHVLLLHELRVVPIKFTSWCDGKN